MPSETSRKTFLSAGRYQILTKLGEGGMGVVYKARDHNLDTDVVIKLPRRAALAEPGFAERFSREIRSLVKLAHPHIVKITDVGEHNGLPFAVLQFLAGGSLQDRRPRDAAERIVPADPAFLAGWLQAIAEALDFVHQQGYLHRDVKPGNILFDQHGHAYLSDFGVTKVLFATPGQENQNLSAVTEAGCVIGTPAYMAGELIMGEKCDGRTDQYALAVTVYEVLAARVPFTGATPAAVMLKLTSQALTPVSQVNPAIAPRLAAAIARGLAREPARRYPTCRDFALAVLDAVHGAAGRSGPPPVRPEVAKTPAKKAPRDSARGGRARAASDTPAPHDSQTQPLEEGGRPAAAASGSKTAVPPPKKGGLVLLVVALLVLGGAVVFGLYGAVVFPGLFGPRQGGPAGDNKVVPKTVFHGELKGHTGLVGSVAFNRDGTLLVSSSWDGTAIVWDAFTGKEIRKLRGHNGAVTSACFSPDGTRIATGSLDNTIRIWKAETGETLQTLNGHHGPVTGVAFSPHGRAPPSHLGGSLASCGDNHTVKVWEPPGPAPVLNLRLHTKPVWSIAYDADGKRLVSTSADATVRVWDSTTGTELRRFKIPGDSVEGTVFSPDGKRFLSPFGPVVKVWEEGPPPKAPDTGKPPPAPVRAVKDVMVLKGNLDPVLSACFSPDGLRVVSGGGQLGQRGEINVWALTAPDRPRSLKGHTDSVKCVCFSPDGKHIASGSIDRTVRLWDAAGDH